MNFDSWLKLIIYKQIMFRAYSRGPQHKREIARVSGPPYVSDDSYYYVRAKPEKEFATLANLMQNY